MNPQSFNELELKMGLILQRDSSETSSGQRMGPASFEDRPCLLTKLILAIAERWLN